MYVSPNFRSKKMLKDAVAAGQYVRVFSPGPFPAPTDGHTTLEGPHYPENATAVKGRVSQWCQSTLYFGQGKCPALDWSLWRDEHITPICPDGYTVLQGEGYWRHTDGRTEWEPACILIVCHPDTPEWRESLDQLRALYCARFDQSSVLLVRQTVTVEF